MFNAVYRPICRTPAGNLVLGTPFKEAMPEPKYLRQAFEEGVAGERAPTCLKDGTFVAGRRFIGVAYK